MKFKVRKQNRPVQAYMTEDSDVRLSSAHLLPRFSRGGGKNEQETDYLSSTESSNIQGQPGLQETLSQAFPNNPRKKIMKITCNPYAI